MITFKSKGNFEKATRWFDRVKLAVHRGDLEKYGRAGVEALAAATPKDTGTTASCWYYKITDQNGKITISFLNSNVIDYVPIAVILQYGHATGNGGWVEGIDYINPAIRPIFEEMADKAWKEVIKL
jgi:hypothetical protein